MNAFDCQTVRDLLRGCLSRPDDMTGWCALADELIERCVAPEVAHERPSVPIRYWDIWRFEGSGNGSGSGIGSGRGRGSGSGSGSGRGNGSGKSSDNSHGVYLMEPGKCYLIHGGDWHTFCVRVVRQVGPMTYLCDCVSKVSETNNGDVWHMLAGGDEAARKRATYAHYDTPAVLPLTIVAFEWVGDLPHPNFKATGAA